MMTNEEIRLRILEALLASDQGVLVDQLLEVINMLERIVLHDQFRDDKDAN